ncbi:DUF192 domain-containing protein [Lacisediminimonas sp.]|uniref:DUF192 domain-containing protein n=1 Tax=Lacisediminimonas sp. TaxID=3060582 RepID=UPI002718BC07|nr:DUF192 domain-containing protein [Lacisediminimonas sp.]MDO8299098.1 DUF192 domain-containing protein [Lacisediminimonas sp.]
MKSSLLQRSMALLLCLAAAAASAESRLPIVELSAGMHVVRAEVAARNEDRAQGLMFRKKMGANEGMLFVFDEPQKICMWMKNTYIPLSVAFLDEKARIINIEDMAPQRLDSHCAQQPARYALEMNLGWFRQKNIKPGTEIVGIR